MIQTTTRPGFTQVNLLPPENRERQEAKRKTQFVGLAGGLVIAALVFFSIIENSRVELKRLEYPVENTVTTVLQSNLPEPAKALLAEVFRTGGLAKPDSGRVKSEPPTTTVPAA